MYQNWKNIFVAVLSLMLVVISGCARVVSVDLPSEASSEVLEIKEGGDVHYEAVDERGVFISHEIMTDPLSAQYEPGIAKANKLSAQKPILDNGPTSNRVDLVFVGDGYTASELTKYADDSQRIVNSYFNQEPLKSYKSYFNVHRIDVVSAQSGVDNDPTKGISKNTALDMNYFCSNTERLLCVNVAKAKQHAANAPQVDQILVLANSTKYGGAGYWSDGIATMAAGNSSAVELALHELAHSFAKIGDEYTTAGSSASQCLGQVNGSRVPASEMLSKKQKWWRWLDLSHINTFEGTCYTASGAYRPTANSKMRTLGQPFYEVNSEQYIFQIYSKVKPIESGTAAGTYDQSVVLNIKPMQPDSHSLDLRWFLNGVEVTSSAQVQNLNVAGLGLAAGKHTIMAKVSDLTTRVRDEARRESLMTQTRSWTIDVASTGTPVNQAPKALNDSVSTLQDVAVIIDALANDSDPEGDAITLASVAAATLGTATIENQKIKYVPFANKNGVDVFTYSVKDSKGAQSSASVTVNIGAVNRLPIANDDSARTAPNTVVAIKVLANDSDPDGDAISIHSVGAIANGSVIVDGSELRYTPNSGYQGQDSFSYSIRDSQGAEASARVTVDVGVSPTFIAFDGLDSNRNWTTARNVVGLQFDVHVPITLSKISFDVMLQEGFNNIAVFKEGSATPLLILKGSTASGEYSVNTNLSLPQGRYMVVVLAAKYKMTSTKVLKVSSDFKVIGGIRRAANGVLLYPTVTPSKTYVFGNINLEYKK